MCGVYSNASYLPNPCHQCLYCGRRCILQSFVCHCVCVAIPIIKTCSSDHLVFIMEIPIPRKMVFILKPGHGGQELHITTPPCFHLIGIANTKSSVPCVRCWHCDGAWYCIIYNAQSVGYYYDPATTKSKRAALLLHANKGFEGNMGNISTT